MKKFFRIQKERARRIYYRFLTWWPVWFYIRNLEARRLFEVDTDKSLNTVQKNIVNTLNKNGIATASILDLMSESEWQELRSYVLTKIESPATQAQIASRRSAPAGRGDKYFNIDLLGEPALDLENPFVKFCLNDKILQIVSTYMQMYAKFRGMRLWATFPVPEGALEHSSQQWHRDPEDKKMVKVFIYYNDVDEEAGPFTYVKSSQHGGVWRHVFPQAPPIGFYPPRGAVEKIIPPEYIYQATGKVGTVIFCDTSGLHKGGYARSKPRYMSQSVYASSVSREPLNYTYPSGLDTTKLSARAQYALDN